VAGGIEITAQYQTILTRVGPQARGSIDAIVAQLTGPRPVDSSTSGHLRHLGRLNSRPTIVRRFGSGYDYEQGISVGILLQNR